VLDPAGTERHRIEGFLPVDDFVAQLELGLAKLAFEGKEYAEAERRFRSVCDSHPGAGAAPEACYWAGVSAYKATDVAQPLKETAKLLKERYPESEWTRKASVWSG
jgi:outer membrane protein assembly factor BamD (BamD/ComL family)